MKIDVNSLRKEVRKLERLGHYGLRALEKIQILLDDENPSAAMARARRASEALSEDVDEVDTCRAIRALRSRAGPPGSVAWALEQEIEQLSELVSGALSALLLVERELDEDETGVHAAAEAARAIDDLNETLGERAARRRSRERTRETPRPAMGPVSQQDTNTRGVA